MLDIGRIFSLIVCMSTDLAYIRYKHFGTISSNRSVISLQAALEFAHIRTKPSVLFIISVMAATKVRVLPVPKVENIFSIENFFNHSIGLFTWWSKQKKRNWAIMRCHNASNRRLLLHIQHFSILENELFTVHCSVES